jgi:tetratricopeptide (TPR) repeat protein
MQSSPPPRNPSGPPPAGADTRTRAPGIPSFETKLENEEEVVDALLVALSKNQLDDGIWQELHDAAVRHDRVSELAFAYESVSQGRKLKTFLPPVQAELYFRAAAFFGEVLGDEFGATTYLEKALTAWPAHAGAFERIDAQLTRVDDNKKLADLCIHTAQHRTKAEQSMLLKRAAVLYERANLEDKAIETYQNLVKIDPSDESLRNALEARYVKANRHRDVARMLEQALVSEPPPEAEDAARIRGKLVEVFANQLKEPERAMPHVEALLEVDPTHPDARRVATRLLESKGLAARAAAALAAGAPTTEERARYLGIELENTRGPRRRDVLRRIGILKQDELKDPQGAFDAFEQALGIDPADDDLRRRYVELGSHLKGPLEVARTFARVSTVAKDAAVRSRITAEMGELLLRGGDAKRARTTLAGVLSASAADPAAVLVAARALAGVYEAEHDPKNLVDVLSRIGEISNDTAEKQRANERVAQICSDDLHDVERAITAWRRLVDSPARERALAALEPLYEARGDWIDLSFVLEQRAKDIMSRLLNPPNDGDRGQARELSFRAGEVLTQKAKDQNSAAEAWRQMIETYGPARDVYAQWMPILEAQRQWPELASALVRDAELAPVDERPAILARLGLVYLTRTRNQDAAIQAFSTALSVDPQEKTSRATLEKLLAAGEHRLAAAAVLEPVYRRDDDVTGLLRVLDIKSQLSPIVQDRLAALEEAADTAISVSREKALDVVARGLAEAVESNEPIGPWLGRFDLFAGDTDRKKRAAILGKGLGEHPITSNDLLVLAKRVGEEHAASGDVGAALTALRRALAYEPASTELLARVDELLRESGNPEERVSLYRAALERGPEPARRKELLHSIGSIERYELMNPDAAIGAYKRALKDDPTDQAAHSALTELYAETEAWEDLCDVLEAHLPHASSPEEARRARAQLAEVAGAHGQKERAALHAKALLADLDLLAADLDLVERVATTIEDPDLVRAVLERRVRDAADPRQQVQCLERLAVLDRSAGYMTRATERLRQAADVARGMGDDPAAIGLLVALREIDPRDAQATSQLVELYEKSGDYVRVPALTSVLLDLTSEDAERVPLLRNLARTFADRIGNLPGAFTAARGAFSIAPFDREVLAELEALAIRTGSVDDFADAVSEAMIAITEAKGTEAHDAEGAGPESSRVARSTPTDLTLAKARVLATTPATVADAALAYRTVLEKARSEDAVTLPGDDAHRTAADEGLDALLKAMPPSDERTADLRWLLEYRVENAKTEERGRALTAWATVEETELGDPARALVLYKKVIDAEPDDFEALAAVSRLSLAQGDVEGALTALIARRAASEGDARNALDVQIATILAGRPGRGREAIERIAGVLEAAPHDPQALELAAKLLHDPEVTARAAEVLEKSLDAVDDPLMRVDILQRLIGHGEVLSPGTRGSEVRLGQYERLLDLLAEVDKGGEAYEMVVRAAKELPRHAVLWDRAETIARQLSQPDPVAALYEEVLRQDLPKSEAIELGQRAVAFYEEWYEDGSRVVGILERLLEVEPDDTWAFDRLKLIFDAQERWDDLFALYDRAAASADKERRLELLEEAAQIAKDFANHSKRAIGYLEQLLELKPGNTRLSAALERLYERHGCHRELITLLGNRIQQLPHEEAQRERVRIAGLWLSELSDASSAIIVIEDLIANMPAEGEGDPPPPARPMSGSIPPPPLPAIDVTDLLERVLAVAPKTAEVRESLPPPPEGRRDSYLPMAPKRGLVRQRAAALLKERYAEPGREADLARVLEVELEAVKSVKERIRRHQQIAAIYAQLGDDEHGMEHFVQLVLLEPEVPAHRHELAQLAARVGRFERLAEVLVSAADDGNDDTLKVELLMHAGVVTAEKIGDISRAIELFFRILAVSPISDEALLAACRHVEPLLEQAGRKTDRLDVLERLAILEEEHEVRWRVLGEAARLATELQEDDRAIWAWEGRLETAPDDPEALDGLVVLFEKAERWRPLIEALAKRGKLERATNERDQQRADRVRVATILSEKLEATEEAIETWRDVEKTFGDSDEGTRALSALYRSTRMWKELAELLSHSAHSAGAAGRTQSVAEKAEILRELGDVQREQLDAIPEAIASYEAALGHDPRSEGSRVGLRALLKRSEHRADVVRVLLVAYNAADDWRLVLDLTEHRLNTAKETEAQIAILMEAAKISETRASDPEAAFALVRRALLLDPADESKTTLEELFRLAELTRSFRSLADALREGIENPVDPAGAARSAWARSLRFRMGEVLETRLDELRSSLESYVHVAHEDPTDLDAARAVIRVAGRTMRWDAAARVIVETTRARETLEPALVQAVEDAAGASSGWDAATFALASLVQGGGELPPNLARDLEAAIAVWHRDRRGDPDAAEAAYARALAHDAANAGMLAELTKLQRRAKGRPLVDSLLRLSQATGGDLDLLTEAADAAISSVGDRALSKSILDRLLRLAIERWTNGLPADTTEMLAVDDSVSSGTPAAPETYVDRATTELVKIYEGDGDHDKVVALLVETSALPWTREKSRALRHEAARIAVEKLLPGAPDTQADRATGIYLQLIDEDPQDADAVERLVKLYVAAGRKPELLALKRRLVGTALTLDARLVLRLEVATLEDELGDVTTKARAVAALEENLGEAPRHDATVKMLSTLFARDGKHSELEALFAGQAELAEKDGEAKLAADLHGRAAEVAETRLGDVPSAIRHLRRLVDLEARAPALDALARLSTTARDHEGAAGYLDRLREMAEGPARSTVTLRLADALVAAGKTPDAQERLENEVARDPEADQVRMRLAEMYRAAQSWRSLAELLTEGATHAPDKATRLGRLREAAELHRSRTGEPERAIPLLEQASDLSPDDNAVKLALADALGAAGRFEEARTNLRTLVEAFGGRRPKERAPVHYHLARLDLAVGDRARALVELDAATRIDPANPEILRTLAELARDDGQLDRAERSYRALLTVLRRQDEITEDAPISRSEVMFELSKIAGRQGEPDRAKEILESAFELSAESVVEARRLEAALRGADDHGNLVRALEARITRSGTPADASSIYGELGRLYEEHLGRVEDAFEMRLRALDIDAGSDVIHEAAQRLATTLGKMATYEQRVRALAEAAQDGSAGGGRRPGAPQLPGLAAHADTELAGSLFVRLARIAETERNDDREAAALYERAVAVRERDRELYSALDRVYERLGDDAGQARVLGMRVALDTEEGGASSDALYRLAQLRFKSNDVEAACDAFEQAFDGDPDADRAEKLLESAASAHPTSERVVDLYERLARAPGRERTLVDALVKRWALPNSTTQPMREAVEIAEKLEDRDLSESLLRRYLEGGQEDKEGRVWALAKLAWISEETGNVREAVLLKREAAELAEPDDARRFLYEVAGLASGPLGDLRLAGTIYEELHERDPVDRDAWELLLDIYRRTNEFDKLVALIQEIVGYVEDRAERSKLRLERVKVSMEKLRLTDEDAAVELREIVDEDPAQVDGAILLGTILERSGREEDLVELLGKQLDAAKDRQDADAVGSLSRRLGQLLEPKDRAQAQTIYYAALDWDPRAKEILFALEVLHEQAEETEQRADIMERRLVMEQGEAAEKLALLLSEMRRGMGEAEAALRALEVGFKASPQSRDLRERLESVYREQLEYDKLADLYVTDARGRHDAHSKATRLREAAKLYREELSDPEQGAKILREARELDPGNAELLGELVDMLTASGELKVAVDELTSSIQVLEAGDARTQLLGRRAVLRARLGEGEAAHADFEEAIELGLYDLRGPLAEHLGKLAMQAAGRGDSNAWRQYRLRIAQMRLAMGDVEDARNVLTELLKTDSKDKATLRAIAHVDELEERWDAASATYRRLVGLEDEHGIVSAALKLAETCEKAGRLADARGGLERARMAAPDDVALRQRLAWLYEQLGAVKELAELVLEEARAAGEVAPRFEGLMRAGQLFLEHAQDPAQTQDASVANAIAPLEEAHALRPTDLDCAALLSDAYVGAGRFEEAQDLLLRTIGTFKGRRARELSALYHRLARVAEFLGDRNVELQHLTTALDMDAQNGVVASELAYLAMELQNLDVAQRALRAITMLKLAAPLPKALAYQHLGEIAKQQGDVKRAMMLLKRAIDDDPSLQSARTLLDALQAET